MGCCVSCALGDAPHKPGYGYGGDVVKSQAENPTIQTQLGLDDFPGTRTADQLVLDATKSKTSKVPPGVAVTASGDPGGGGPNSSASAPAGFSPPRDQPNGAFQTPPRPPAGLQQPPPALGAPQAQGIPAVATFEMNSKTSPPQPFDPYNQPALERPGVFRGNRASAALSIISTYESDLPNRGGMGGRGGQGNMRGGMAPGPNNRSRERDYPDRGGRGGIPPRGGMSTRQDSRGPAGQRGGFSPPFAGEQRPSSRQGGRPDQRGGFSPPFAGEQRPSSRQGGRPDQRGGFSPPYAGGPRPSSRNGSGRNGFAPPFAGEARPSSRQGGGGRGGSPLNRGAPFNGGPGMYPPRGRGSGPPPHQQLPSPPQ